MAYDTHFGPAAQTPAQCAGVLEQLQAALPYLKTNARPSARQLDARSLRGRRTRANFRLVYMVSTVINPLFRVLRRYRVRRGLDYGFQDLAGAGLGRCKARF
jgi:hypothetical protein